MSKTPPGKPRSSWPIRVIALLLLLQAIGLVAGNGYNVYLRVGEKSETELEVIVEQIDAEEDLDKLPPETIKMLKAVVSAVMLMPLAIPAVLAAVAFLFLWRFGWALAMITQVLNLLVCLMLYLEIKSFIVYPIMVYCIFMVLYLNVRDVRLAFQTRRAGRGTRARRQR